MVTTRGQNQKKALEALKATTATRSAKRSKKASQAHKNKSSKPQLKTNVGVLHRPASSFLKSFNDDIRSVECQIWDGETSDGEVQSDDCSVQALEELLEFGVVLN